MDIKTINQKISSDAAEFVKESEEFYYGQIEKTAERIDSEASSRPLVLLSGPSGSGKTTTALALERLLNKWGHRTHTVSMDNYFKTITPEEQNGKNIDLESPARLDIELLNSQLNDMAKGRPVELPKYDFKNSVSLPSGRFIERKPGDIIIMEGIHSLNPEVITIEDRYFTSIYVSVRTRITTPELTLHPEKIRLLRRMLRDSSYRGRSIKDTVNMYPSVQHGETRFIMPHKNRAQCQIDSIIAYELSVYKKYLCGLLKEYDGLEDVRYVLSNTEDLDDKYVAEDSLVREFIGGSCFNY
jgi:uridine kinase